MIDDFEELEADLAEPAVFLHIYTRKGNQADRSSYHITLNKRAGELFGNSDMVTVGINTERKIVGLFPAQKASKNARAMSRFKGTMSASFNFAKLGRLMEPYGNSFPCEWVDKGGYLRIRLTEGRTVDRSVHGWRQSERNDREE